MACAEIRRGALAALLLALGGCAFTPDPPAAPPPFPGVDRDHDLRASFRAAVCARLGGTIAACEPRLRREEGEAAAVPPPVRAPDTASAYRVGFVPGLFAECLAPRLRPFGDVEQALRARGLAVEYFDVPGRGSAEGNGRFLAARLAALEPDPRPWILVTYSKGLADALEAVASHPESAKRVAAIVSFAGASNGSPLADALHEAYREFVAGLPLPGCAGGGGHEIDSLRRDVRRAWWARNGERITVPVFTLVAMPSRDRVSYGSRLTHARLSRIDARNDGKLLWNDQLVPNGFLLGFADADHWTVAVPVARDLPALARLFHDDIPRTALVEGALDLVAARLARDKAPPR